MSENSNNESTGEIVVKSSKSFLMNNWPWLITQLITLTVFITMLQSSVTGLEESNKELIKKVENLSLIVTRYEYPIDEAQNKLDMLEARILILEKRVAELTASEKYYDRRWESGK